MIHYITSNGIGNAWVEAELETLRRSGVPFVLHTLRMPTRHFFGSPDALLVNQKNDLPQQMKSMQDNHLAWKAVKLAGRDVDEKMLPVNELAFNLPRVGDTAGARLPDGDYVVVTLKAINNGRLDRLDDDQLTSIRQQIESNDGIMDYELYVNGLMSKATIVTH